MVTFLDSHEFSGGQYPPPVRCRILHGESFQDVFANLSRHRTILAGIGALRKPLGPVSAAILSFATVRLSPGWTFIRLSVICLQAGKGNSRSIPVYPAKPGFAEIRLEPCRVLDIVPMHRNVSRSMRGAIRWNCA